MKRMMAGLVAAGLAWAGAAAGQDMPGFGAGAFYEYRVDNEVLDEELEFDYYGARIQLRDARWFHVFADLGAQSGEWGEYDADAAGFFGIGGTLWLVRAEDLMVPLDLGIFGSFHRGDFDFDPPSGPEQEAEYLKMVGQAVIRFAGYDNMIPFVRIGVMNSDLDLDGPGDDNDWDVTNPAVNAGIEFMPTDAFSLTLEGNYSESVGFGIRGDLWF